MGKNKLTLFLLIAVFFAGLTSCSDDDPELTVSGNEISLAIGAKRAIVIAGGYPGYSVRSDDETIATASLTNNVLTIYAVGTGVTSVTVFDEKSSVVTIPVTVRLYSSTLELTIDSLHVKAEVDDDEVKQAIEEALYNSFPFPKGTRYVLGFPYDQPGDLFIYPAGQNEDVINGTFNTGDTETWTFSYEGKEISYTVEEIVMTKTSPIEPVSLLLIEDFTAFYQDAYPDAGINKVQRAQISFPESIKSGTDIPAESSK